MTETPVPHLQYANFVGDRSTGATWAQAGHKLKKSKRRGKKLAVANWVFAQTTHVDAVT